MKSPFYFADKEKLLCFILQKGNFLVHNSHYEKLIRLSSNFNYQNLFNELIFIIVLDQTGTVQNLVMNR